VVKASDGRIVYVDPYLSDSPDRLVKPWLTAELVNHADLVVGTHDHGDHIDRPAWPVLAMASPKAVFAAPAAARDRLATALGWPPGRIAGIDVGAPFRMDGLTVSAVPAAHERLEAAAGGPGHPCLGLVLEAGGARVYHAGDTCVYEGIWAWLRRWPRLSAMLLPINGRDAWRYGHDCLGNMTWQEAVDLAGEMEPLLAVPSHWGMFAMNTEDPARFAEYARIKYPALAVHVPALGVRFNVRSGV